MYRELIDHISDEKLRKAFINTLATIKDMNSEVYECVEKKIYKEAYGNHFCEWLLNKALAEMENEDGTTGGRWGLTDSKQIALSLNVSFDSFNEYDWNYVLNMMYSDYYGSVSNDTTTYGKMAKKFLCDKDAKEGKALRYYFAMK